MAEKNTLSILESIKKKMANFDEKQARASSAFDSDDFDYNDQGLTNNAQEMDNKSMLSEVESDEQGYDDDNEDLSEERNKIVKDNEEFLFEESDDDDFNGDFIDEDDALQDIEEDNDLEESEDDEDEYEDGDEEESFFEDPLENIDVDDDLSDFDDALNLNEGRLSEEDEEENNEYDEIEENVDAKEEIADFSQHVDLDAFKDEDDDYDDNTDSEDESSDEQDLENVDDNLEEIVEEQDGSSFIDNEIDDDMLEEENVISEISEEDFDDELSHLDVDLDSDDDIVDQSSPNKIKANFVEEKTKIDDNAFEEEILDDEPEVVTNNDVGDSIKIKVSSEFDDLMKNIDLDLDDEQEQVHEESEIVEEKNLELEEEEMVVEPEFIKPELEIKDTISEVEPEVVEVQSQIKDVNFDHHNQLSAMPEIHHDKPLLDEETVQKTSQSIKKLIDANKIVHGMKSFSQNGGAAFGEMALQLMEPKIEKWINDNLPDMVEKIVRQEIERIIPDLNDHDDS